MFNAYLCFKFFINVVTPGLLKELRNAGVPISESGRLNKNAAWEGGEKVKYSLKGTTADGIEVYETSDEVRMLPWRERRQRFLDIMQSEYKGRTAKFTANGDVYYAKFDEADLQKNMYGDTKSSPHGRDAKINTGADGSIFELVENTTHSGSSVERGKTAKAHKGVTGWEYFVKTVQVDGQVFDLLANVRKKEGGEYVYSIQLNENKKISASPVAMPAHGIASKWGTTDNVSIRTADENVNRKFSLKEYTDEEKRQHVKDAVDYFGSTSSWNETGYITTDGKRLDFSGKHEGGPGGYRTVDHRDISDALGEGYGGEDYSGAMVQFMAEGNIRISPESGGINLSVMPTKAQMDTLSDFISRQRGEVILDLDNAEGNTVSSTEYPRGTHANRVLADIKAYFEEGKQPYVSEVSRFRYSLKDTRDTEDLVRLNEENALLRDLVKRWKVTLDKQEQQIGRLKGEMKRTKEISMDREQLGKAARRLAKDYSAKADVSADLASLYNYMLRGGEEFTYTEARERAMGIAEELINSAVEIDRTLYETYEDLRRELRGVRLNVGDNALGQYESVKELRQAMYGKLNVANGERSNIDDVYQQLSAKWGEFFPESIINPEDQIERIVDVVQALYTATEYNPFSSDMNSAVRSAANDILERFFDLPQTKKTFADRQAAKLEAAQAKGRGRVREAIERERSKRDDALIAG